MLMEFTRDEGLGESSYEDYSNTPSVHLAKKFMHDQSPLSEEKKQQAKLVGLPNDNIKIEALDTLESYYHSQFPKLLYT
jgi:hypothetical protein